jgi:hypothetical protein
VHPIGLRLFEATVWKILTIEPFFSSKLNKIKVEDCVGIWGHLGVVGKHSASQI